MQALIVTLACCGIASAAVYWSCPKAHVTKEDREKVRGMLLAKVKVESVEVKGNMHYDLINYKLKYEECYERWYDLYYYLPNPLKITARSKINGKVRRCRNTLEVGKKYYVGFNGYFRFAVDSDNLTKQDRDLLGDKIHQPSSC
ncbi:hypothetical protein Y032_0218g2420 [Ancylostoma ceylanicum]|uniref:Uncharacterized protein n=1 Tax=Ancylostoma ceylanicum TaxID=53326 RepID=A0A016SJN3_9BILA|nr:hypothetical protein Y032_0218g2420 [Ancylostoma ceylanicum]